MLDKALLEWVNCHIRKYKKLPLFDKLRLRLFSKKHTNNDYVFYIYKDHLYITKLIRK